MDTKRVILYAILGFILFHLWTNWQQSFNPAQSNAEHSTVISNSNSSSEQQNSAAHDNKKLDIPLNNDMADEKNSSASSSITLNNPQAKTEEASLITVKTDVLRLEIDPVQGNIVESSLLAYPIDVNSPQSPFILLNNNKNGRYTANSSIVSSENDQIKNVNFNFKSMRSHYELNSEAHNREASNSSPTARTLVVSLKGATAEGIKAVKEFIFRPGNYLIEVNYKLENQGEKPWTGYLNTQLLRNSPQEDESSLFHVGSYTGSSYSNPEQSRYKKLPFKKMTKENLEVSVKDGWIAMQQHYFLTAWIPEKGSKNIFYTRVEDNNYSIGAVSQPISLAPKEQKQISAKLYLGPEITKTLQSIAPGLDLTVDYGWLWFLSSALFSLMKLIHKIIGNWGWTIVLVTFLIKLAFYRLSAASYKSMANMRKLQPAMQALKERYGDDKAKISQATMELYRKEKVNPLGGCLPILIQIPVFIALYWVLLESVELRHAPFIFWIKDLAAADPFHVLPIIMGATMLIQQKLNPTPPDPMQAKIMMFLPIVFTGLFWNFPAGLVLYWIVNNSLSILQQWYITNKYGKNDNNEPNKAKLVAVK